MKKKGTYRWLRWLLRGLLVALCLGVLSLFFSHRQPTDRALSHRLTILTYNTDRLGSFRKAASNRVIANILDTDADIVCLQEVEVYKDPKYMTLPELKEALSRYPYTYFDFKIYNSRRQYGLAVFSKYPLTHKQTIPYTSRGNISDFCDVVIGEDTLRLFNNHLESNRLDYHDLPDSVSSDAIKSSAKRINEKMVRARPRRHEQAQAVRSAIDASPYPVIVVGDFNSLPLSRTYTRIRFGAKGNLRDCFLESSFGRVGNTFKTHHIGIRIDYILCSQTLYPLRTEVRHLSGSDHFPLIVELGW